MIEVYNVGQGDSFLLIHNKECKQYPNKILIDCGVEKAKVYKKISYQIEDVLITHSHNDHIGGLSSIIKNFKIKNIYIPYFLPEILEIDNYFQSKVNLKKNPLHLSSLKDIKFHPLKEGDKLCSHIQIFNPSIDIKKIFNIQNISNNKLTEAIEHINNLLDLDINTNNIINYQPIILDQINDQDKEEYLIAARNFIQSFFISLYETIRNSKSKNKFKSYFLKLAKNKIKYSANRISIVLKYDDKDTSYLFTGDADKVVFNRIIKDSKYNLKAIILKVPHHGSKENINKKIISEINPKYAIVSHDNYKNLHPSEDVIHWFELDGTKILLTNNIKRTTTLIRTTKQFTGRINDDVIFK